MNSLKQILPLPSPLQTFYYCVENVPAYADFLKSKKFDATTVCHESDLKNIPIITKENYILTYPLESLCAGGNLKQVAHIASSSGSSGTSLYWPRIAESEAISLAYFANIFSALFEADRKSTLIINSFALGAWVAGFEFYNAAKELTKDYPASIVTPGPDIAETLRMISSIGGTFEQLIICGYPPFVKDIIEAGITEGVEWEKKRIRLLLAGEPISEEWRARVGMLLACDTTDIINVYGMAEAGILAHETPSSIAHRASNVLPEGVTSLYQYNPSLRHIEVGDDGHLLLTTMSAIPLVRYDTKDHGGVLGARTFGKNEGVSFASWPYVYLLGRLDSATTIYGVNIYADTIKAALHTQDLTHFITGKFTMEQGHDVNQDPCIHIDVELRKDQSMSGDLEKSVSEAVDVRLQQDTSEYRKLVMMIGSKATPVIRLKQYGEIGYVAGRKHKWVKRG